MLTDEKYYLMKSTKEVSRWGIGRAWQEANGNISPVKLFCLTKGGSSDITFWSFVWFFTPFPIFLSTRQHKCKDCLWDHVFQIRCLIWPTKETRISGYLQGALMNSVRQRFWISKSRMQKMCPLPRNHQPIKFICMSQVWNTGTIPDKESKLQLPRSKHLVFRTPRTVLAEPQPHCSCMKPFTMNH